MDLRKQAGHGAGLKYRHETVAAAIQECGYELESEYENSYSLMDVRCKNGHLWKIKWDKFKESVIRQGKGCPHCSGKSHLGIKPGSKRIKMRHTYEGWQSLAKSYEWEILDSPPEECSWTGRDRVRVRCKNGHEMVKPLTAFFASNKKDRGCRQCNLEDRKFHPFRYSVARWSFTWWKKNLSIVKLKFRDNGWALKGIDIPNQSITIECSNGHPRVVTNKWRYNYTCRDCNPMGKPKKALSDNLIIYKITNIDNNKVYIGQTCQDLEVRIKAHKYYNGVISKNKMENYTIDVLEECDTLSDLDERERYWINHYDSIKNGYNKYVGGSNTRTYNRTYILTLPDGTEEEWKSMKAISRKYPVNYSALQVLSTKGYLGSKHKRTDNRDGYKIRIKGEHNE